MRISISGTHATGKSSLVAALARELPSYLTIDEPYHTLAEEGHAFAARPSVDDFELLLDRALAALDGSLPPNVLFDRCPADYLAYLVALRGVDTVQLPSRLPRVAEAMARLDLVVFVPLERPDRVAVDASEGRRLRRRVDAVLREMLVENGWGFAARVIEVSGTPEARARQVLSHLRDDPGAGTLASADRAVSQNRVHDDHR